MENKKLGILLIIISLIIGGTFIYYINSLATESEQLGCFQGEDCLRIERGLSVSHFATGVVAFILALGFYLLLFNKTDERIMKRLETEKNSRIKDEKFNYILMALDPSEQKVMKLIKLQDGITQNSLRIKSDLSKAKLSYVLQELEKRNLIRRAKSGKTLSINLKI